jgi:nitrogen-specific signal transduction histidine kinase
VSNERDFITFPTRRHLKNARSSKTMGNASDQIPAEVARELRMLAHDLSNALETIVQATYLISQAAPPENLRRWVELIDQASEEAVKINHKLRQVLRSQS